MRGEGVVDTRLLGKPKSFDGSTDSWRQFKFTFLGYAGAVDSRLKQVMIESEVLPEASITNSALPARDQRVSTQLYYMLVLLLEGSAQRLLEHAGDGEGLLSWRRLVAEYEPATAGRETSVLLEVLAQTFKGDVRGSFDEVEVKIRRYERSCNEVLSDRVKIAVVQKGIEDEDLRRQRSIIMARETLNGPTPMDVSAIYKGKKGKENCKSKGKKGKGKSKGKIDDKVKEKDPTATPDAEIICYYCHRKGHRKRDCRAIEKDNKKGGNAVDQAPGLTPGADAAPSGTPSRVSMIELDNWILAVNVEENEKMVGSIERVMVDIGAVVSVCPLGYAPEIPMTNHSRRATLRTATGQKTVEYENSDGGSVNVSFEVADVTRPLVAVGELQKRGMTVVMGPHGSFVRGHVTKPPGSNLDLEHSNGAYWLCLTRGGNGTSTVAPVDLGDAVPTENLSDLPAVEDTIHVAREDEEANVPLAVPSPKEPGAAERARHELTHMPKKSWCFSCVAGRGADDAHRKSDDYTGPPRVECDFMS